MQLAPQLWGAFGSESFMTAYGAQNFLFFVCVFSASYLNLADLDSNVPETVSRPVTGKAPPCIPQRSGRLCTDFAREDTSMCLSLWMQWLS